MALRSSKLFLFSPLHGFADKGRPVWQRKSSMAELDNEELRRLKDVNMDEAPARRLVRDCFKDIQHNLDHILIKTPGDGIKTKESYEVNSRGVEIFSKSWLPEAASRPRALVCFCHGIARRLALSGYGVFAMDYPGFGLSEGLHGYISSFDLLVEDVIEHYSNIKEKPEFSSLPSFLFGQSMGGAVSLKIHFKQPNAWTGAVLVAPMCKAPYNVICYCDKPRLRTAVEMLRTTQEIEQQLHKVCLPILILHGEADRMTDPSVSRDLYEKAKSSDKKIVLYKDAYHSLLEGEPDEVILLVLSDIISWLDDHSLQVEGS
ncbi:hypothetical protein IGI04_041351 [Brassica rapa subsp. trilocularis]|nr:hypothetical protein IGI04_041351 [Brassica rapa subsp. trilocularis]